MPVNTQKPSPKRALSIALLSLLVATLFPPLALSQERLDQSVAERGRRAASTRDAGTDQEVFDSSRGDLRLRSLPVEITSADEISPTSDASDSVTPCTGRDCRRPAGRGSAESSTSRGESRSLGNRGRRREARDRGRLNTPTSEDEGRDLSGDLVSVEIDDEMPPSVGQPDEIAIHRSLPVVVDTPPVNDPEGGVIERERPAYLHREAASGAVELPPVVDDPPAPISPYTIFRTFEDERQAARSLVASLALRVAQQGDCAPLADEPAADDLEAFGGDADDNSSFFINDTTNPCAEAGGVFVHLPEDHYRARGYTVMRSGSGPHLGVNADNSFDVVEKTEWVVSPQLDSTGRRRCFRQTKTTQVLFTWKYCPERRQFVLISEEVVRTYYGAPQEIDCPEGYDVEPQIPAPIDPSAFDPCPDDPIASASSPDDWYHQRYRGETWSIVRTVPTNEGRVDLVVRDYALYHESTPPMRMVNGRPVAVLDDSQPTQCSVRRIHIEERNYWTWCEQTQTWHLQDSTEYVSYEGPWVQIPCSQMPR